MSDFPRFIAKKLIEGDAPLASHLVILPTQRGATYIKARLKSLLTDATWMPQFTTLNQWAQRLSGLQAADNLELKFACYRAYSEVLGSGAQPFSEFFSWCDTLIRDFNEIESRLIPRLPFFKELTDYSEIEHFSFLESPLTEKQENYRKFWRALPDIHQKFNEILLAAGIGYSGLIIKKALEKISKPNFQFDEKIIVAGFNALSAGEAQLLTTIQEKKAGAIYYDADEYYLSDSVNHAGHFIRQNLNAGLGEAVYTSAPLDKREWRVEICEAGQRIDQVQIAVGLLQEMSEAERKKTVLVLADEKLLIPLLDKLPDEVAKPNITMGISVTDSTFATGLKLIYSIDSLSVKNKNNILFPSVKLQEFFAHPFTNLLLRPQKDWIDLSAIYTSGNALNDALSKSNYPVIHSALAFWNCEESKKHEAVKLLIETVESALKQIEKWSIDKLQALEAISLLQRTLVQIDNLKLNEILTTDNHLKVLLGAISGGSVNSVGDPIDDMQIMGLLETRPLSFDRVIVVGVNEEILPGSSSLDSFVPFEIRRYHKMPGRREKEAVYAYNFFRLLQHANHVQLIYSSDRSSFSGGEKSRYIQQIEYELAPANGQLKLENRFLETLPTDDYFYLKAIPKTSEIADKIILHLENGLSISSINSFLEDSLNWYYKYVLRIAEPEIREVNPASYGTVVHEVLENLYKPFKNEIISIAILDKMKSEASMELGRIFAATFPTTDFESGINKIHYETAKSMLFKFLQSEKKLIEKGDEVVFVASEEKLERTTIVETRGKKIQVRLKGFIDKIERRNGMLEIIDYKSGRVESKDIRPHEFSVDKLKKLPKTVQLLTYNWMASAAYRENDLNARIITLPAPANRRLSIKHIAEEDEAFENFIGEVVDKMISFEENFIKNPEFEYAVFE